MHRPPALSPASVCLLASGVLLAFIGVGADCGLLGTSYGVPCVSDDECSGTACFDTPREGSGERRCLTREPGPVGSECIDILECAEGRCEPTTGTCTADALPGLPECDDDLDCPGDEVCIDRFCEAPGESCADDSMCADDETCVEGACVGTDGCADATECADGEACVDGSCVTEDGRCDTSMDCAEGEVCEDGECVEGGACETSADCEDGQVCIDGACGTAYTTIAIVSTTTDEDDLASVTPGPDIDAVALVDADGDTTFASVVERYNRGTNTAEETQWDDPEQALGESDAIPEDGGDCALDESDPLFVSLGGEGEDAETAGVLLVSFEGTIEPDDLLVVYELDAVSCDNVTVRRDDRYEVWAGTDDSDPTEDNGWVFLGSSGEDGGVREFVAVY